MNLFTLIREYAPSISYIIVIIATLVRWRNLTKSERVGYPIIIFFSILCYVFGMQNYFNEYSKLIFSNLSMNLLIVPIVAVIVGYISDKRIQEKTKAFRIYIVRDMEDIFSNIFSSGLSKIYGVNLYGWYVQKKLNLEELNTLLAGRIKRVPKEDFVKGIEIITNEINRLERILYGQGQFVFDIDPEIYKLSSITAHNWRLAQGWWDANLDALFNPEYSKFFWTSIYQINEKYFFVKDFIEIYRLLMDVREKQLSNTKETKEIKKWKDELQKLNR